MLCLGDGGFFFPGVGGDISYLKDQGTVMEQPNPSLQKDGCWLRVEEPSHPASLPHPLHLPSASPVSSSL